MDWKAYFDPRCGLDPYFYDWKAILIRKTVSIPPTLVRLTRRRSAESLCNVRHVWNDGLDAVSFAFYLDLE